MHAGTHHPETVPQVIENRNCIYSFAHCAMRNTKTCKMRNYCDMIGKSFVRNRRVAKPPLNLPRYGRLFEYGCPKQFQIKNKSKIKNYLHYPIIIVYFDKQSTFK